MAKRDYYEVLGVSRKATADEIKKAHRRLVRQHHPDVNKNNPQAEEKFKEVQEAYDVLSETDKRAKYDEFGHAGVGAAAGGGDPYEAYRRAAAARGGARQWKAGPNVSVEDFDMGAGGMGDMFEQLFGGAGRTARPTTGRRGRRQAAPPPDIDIEHPVTLTFEQAARGTTLPLRLSRDGNVETIDVKVPAGVKDGSRVRIRGKGNQYNGQSGDLYIITQVTPHAFFRREDLDVYLDVPISMYEAVLGAKVSVPTLDGPVTLSIPPGASGGAKLRIRGRGVERSGQRGDQFVTLKVIVPKDLDDEDRAAIEAMAKKHPLNARADVKW